MAGLVPLGANLRRVGRAMASEEMASEEDAGPAHNVEEGLRLLRRFMR
jgi:hypothetical protein